MCAIEEENMIVHVLCLSTVPSAPFIRHGTLSLSLSLSPARSLPLSLVRLDSLYVCLLSPSLSIFRCVSILFCLSGLEDSQMEA